MLKHPSHGAQRHVEAARTAEPLPEALEGSLPLCLVRANERFAEGFLVASAPVAAADAELLACGEGPLSLILPVAEWRALKVPTTALTLELDPGSEGGRQPLPPGELAAGLSAVLAGSRSDLPPWLRCVATRPGGFLAHWAPVEAAHELVRRRAGIENAAVLRRMRLPPGDPDPRRFIQGWARERGLPCVDLFDFCERMRAVSEPRLISLPVSARLPVRHGTFTVRIFENPWTGDQHVAMFMGGIDDGAPVLVRMHSECFTGDIMGSLRCDCGPQLDAALARVAREGRGAVLYLRQEGRGIGLYEKLRAYIQQDAGLDTVEANQALGFPPDLRSYLEAADMLRALGVSKVRLLTNNPTKIEELAGGGVEVVGREPLIIEPNPENQGYLETKRIRMGHLLLPLGA